MGTPVTYTRRISAETTTALHLHGAHVPVAVSVDDGEPITVHAENPWMLLPAGTKRISVTVPHDPSGDRLRAELLGLEPVTGWTCAVQDDELLTDFAGRGGPGQDVVLPVAVQPGEEAWLDVDLPASDSGYLLRPEGVQVRVTAWSSGECIGRVWTGERPAFAGGDPDVLWIPPGWAGLTLLVTGVAGPADPELRRLRLDSAT